MPRYKNAAQQIISFDYEGKEKTLEPGKTYKMEPNDYLDGLAAQGILETQDDEPEIKETPKK